MKSKVKILSRPEKALRRLEDITKSFKGPSTVKVGLPAGSNNYPDGTSVVMVGTVHEFGSPKRGIPQRSFLRSTMLEKRRQYKKMFRKLGKSIMSGKMTLNKAMNLIGLQVSSDVKQKIRDIKSPPLKNREGNPLIDTAHLVQTITHQVDK